MVDAAESMHESDVDENHVSLSLTTRHPSRVRKHPAKRYAASSTRLRTGVNVTTSDDPALPDACLQVWKRNIYGTQQ